MTGLDVLAGHKILGNLAGHIEVADNGDVLEKHLSLNAAGLAILIHHALNVLIAVAALQVQYSPGLSSWCMDRLYLICLRLNDRTFLIFSSFAALSCIFILYLFTTLMIIYPLYLKSTSKT